MAQTLGPLHAEYSEAESAKFTAPLVFAHGLWDARHSWRRMTSFLSHRGWRCISLGWDRQQGRSLRSRHDSLREAIADLDAVPVLIGQDLGASLALNLRDSVRAVVALAPLVSAAALRDSGTWLQRLRRADRQPGKGLAGSYPDGDVREPDGLIDELVASPRLIDSVPTGGTAKFLGTLVVAGEEDEVAPAGEVQALAAALHGDFEAVAGAHALHVDDGWEARAGLVHRWLIKNLGEDLLAFYEEAWADRDP